MLTLLIPTDFSDDTISAITNIRKLLKSEPFKVILLNAIPLPDSISEMLFLPNYKNYPPKGFQEALENIKSEELGKNIYIDIHCQYGISEPILDHLISEYKINYSIIPFNPQKQNNIVFDILKNNKTPHIIIPTTCCIDDNLVLGYIMHEPKESNHVGYLSQVKNLFPHRSIYIFNNSDNSVKILDQSWPKNKIGIVLKALNVNLLVEIRERQRKKQMRALAHSYSNIEIPMLTINYN